MEHIFDRVNISKIDVEQTVKNGKETCVLYSPIVEKRLKQLSLVQTNSTSLVCFSENMHTGNNNEKRTFERLSWNDDQISNFIRFVLKLEKKDKILGGFLKYKCFYGLTDNAISEKLNISERTLRNYKSKAYYEVAVYSNQVEFIDENTYNFHLI